MLFELNDSQTYYILQTANYLKSEIDSYKYFLEEDIRKSFYINPNLQELYSERMPFEFYAHEVKLSIVDYNNLKDVKVYKNGVYKPLIIPIRPAFVDSNTHRNQQMPVANPFDVLPPSLNPFINEQIKKAQQILNNNSNNRAALTPIPVTVDLFNRTFELKDELYFGNPDPFETVPELTININSTFAYFFKFYRIPRPFLISDDEKQVTFPAYIFRELDTDENYKKTAERCFTNRVMTRPESTATANNNNNTSNNTNNQTSSQSTSNNSAQEDPFNTPLVRRPLRVRKLPEQRKNTSKANKKGVSQSNPVNVQADNQSQPVNIRPNNQPKSAAVQPSNQQQHTQPVNQQPVNPESSEKRKADSIIVESVKHIRAEVINNSVAPKQMPDVRPVKKPNNHDNRFISNAETIVTISNTVISKSPPAFFQMPPGQGQPAANKPNSKMSINELANAQSQSTSK